MHNFFRRIFFITRGLGPKNEKNPPEKIKHGAVKFSGALIVITKCTNIFMPKIYTNLLQSQAQIFFINYYSKRSLPAKHGAPGGAVQVPLS